jgi:quinol---cytochrome c reductase cytochrome b subunit, bacillus type
MSIQPSVPPTFGPKLTTPWLRRLVFAGAALLAVLLVTGLYLTFRYRPSDTFTNEGRGFVLDATAVVHRVAAYALLVVAAAVGVLGIIAVWKSSIARRLAGAAAAGFLTIAALAAVVSGALLPWDQLALWAVTVGSGHDRFRGVLDFGYGVKYVLIGTSEVSPSTYSRAVWIHILVIPIVLVIAAAAVVRVAGMRRRSAAVDSANVPA